MSAKDCRGDTTETIRIIIPPKPGKEDDYPDDAPITLDICSHSMCSLGKEDDLPASKLPFTWKLYEMLEDVEENGQNHIISWVNNGKGFRVHKMDLFVKDIIPTYFKQSKYKSFQRQLYFYNFKRISRGPDIGSYYHPMFVRGNKTRCLSMTPKKNSSKNDNITTDQEKEHISRVVSNTVEERPHEEASRRVSLESTAKQNQSESPVVAFGKTEEAFIPLRGPLAPALVSFRSDENIERHHSLFHRQHRTQQSLIRSHWRRFQDEEEFNDGAACIVFGSIFHFVHGVPRFD
jgi:hypothetical protein